MPCNRTDKQGAHCKDTMVPKLVFRSVRRFSPLRMGKNQKKRKKNAIFDSTPPYPHWIECAIGCSTSYTFHEKPVGIFTFESRARNEELSRLSQTLKLQALRWRLCLFRVLRPIVQPKAIAGSGKDAIGKSICVVGRKPESI